MADRPGGMIDEVARLRYALFRSQSSDEVVCVPKIETVDEEQVIKQGDSPWVEISPDPYPQRP